MNYRKRSRPSSPAIGAKSQAVMEGLLARVPGLEFCEHDLDGFAMWIATRPGSLLCKFCYQAAQVLAENVTCASCGQPAGDPDKDAMVVAKVTDWLGAHFYLCTSCTDLDIRLGRSG
jgi:hypothetical protein